MAEPNRYLVSFDSKKTLHQFADVLIIGAGIAGLRAALELPAHFTVLVVTKDKLSESNSTYAQGGIAGVRSPEDSFDDHVQDTLTAGDGLCNPSVVEMVVRDAPAQINSLVNWGTKFDEVNGELALTKEGGHSHRRIVHALGDSTGAEVMRAVIATAKAAPNLIIWDETFTIDLLTENGKGCIGAILHKPNIGKIMVRSKQTILASGGCGMVYRETTNPPVATGDGMAAAYRAGAELRDMEFMQFHPTLLYVAGSARYLITEAVRGEGAYLRDVKGERFMLKLDPRAEQATRDVVSRAIFATMERTQHPNVYLDLSHLPTALIRERFPGIAAVCKSFGLNIETDRIPVRPGAHYMVGGVTVDPLGRTTLPNLWAAGEVTSSGLHGANRLASNSLVEGLVFGTSAARGAMETIEKNRDMSAMIQSHYVIPKPTINDNLDVADLTNSLRSLMVRKMGIVRDRERLLEARHDLEFWCRYVLAREFDTRAGWELQNMLTVSQVMIEAALKREESRGTHFRSDFPTRDDKNWQHHVAFVLKRPTANLN